MSQMWMTRSLVAIYLGPPSSRKMRKKNPETGKMESAMTNEDMFADALDRVMTLLEERAKEAEDKAEGVHLNLKSEQSTAEAEEYLLRMEELFVVGHLVNIVEEMAMDMKEMVEREKSAPSFDGGIEVVEMPRSNEKKGSGENLN